jgi:phage tail tape-measure protein
MHEGLDALCDAFSQLRTWENISVIAAGLDLGRTASRRFVLAYAVRSRGAPHRLDYLRGSMARRRLTTRFGNTNATLFERG